MVRQERLGTSMVRDEDTRTTREKGWVAYNNKYTRTGGPQGLALDKDGQPGKRTSRP